MTTFTETSPADDPIRGTVARLSRPHHSGGAVIERAAILAEGTNSTEILAWISAHAGEPELAAPATPVRGLYGGGVTAPRGPARYILPAGDLERTPREWEAT